MSDPKRKDFYIITPDYRHSSTGGLIWINRFADYARSVYAKTTIINTMDFRTLIRNNRLINILYYTIFFIKKKNAFFFIDHNLHIRLSIPLLLSRLIRGNQYAVITFHVLYNLRGNPIAKMIEYYSEKLLLKNAVINIVCSSKTYRDVLKFKVKADKIKIIYPACNYKSDKMPDKKFFKKILFIGNLEPRKGVDVLIKALNLIKAQEFTVSIIGDHYRRGRYYSHLKNLVMQIGLSDKVKFLGKLDANSIVNYYRSGNIFVFPSLHEGYGIVLLEAMSYGLSIIASDIAPINEIITHDVNGFLFSAGNYNDLAGYLLKLLRNPSLQHSFGRRNFEASKKFPTWDTVVERTFNTVQPFLKR